MGVHIEESLMRRREIRIGRYYLFGKNESPMALHTAAIVDESRIKASHVIATDPGFVAADAGANIDCPNPNASGLETGALPKIEGARGARFGEDEGRGARDFSAHKR